MSAQIRNGIAPEPSEPTITSFLIPPALAELDRARPREGTVLRYAVQRAWRERCHPEAASRSFENKF